MDIVGSLASCAFVYNDEKNGFAYFNKDCKWRQGQSLVIEAIVQKVEKSVENSDSAIDQETMKILQRKILHKKLHMKKQSCGRWVHEYLHCSTAAITHES